MSEIETLKTQLESLQAEALAAFSDAADLNALQGLRVH